MRKKLAFITVIGLTIATTFFPAPSAQAHRIYKNSVSKVPAKKMAALYKDLKKRSAAYCEAFEKRSFRAIYNFINPRYRKEVSEDMYVDFIEFPGYTDSYFRVEVLDSAVLPTGKHGKVVVQISVYNYKKELISEKLENQDWILEKNLWYKVEKLQ